MWSIGRPSNLGSGVDFGSSFGGRFSGGHMACGLLACVCVSVSLTTKFEEAKVIRCIGDCVITKPRMFYGKNTPHFAIRACRLPSRS